MTQNNFKKLEYFTELVGNLFIAYIKLFDLFQELAALIWQFLATKRMGFFCHVQLGASKSGVFVEQKKIIKRP